MSELFYYLAIFLLGIVSSFFGSIVGGGGLISIPILIALGLTPQTAIATDRFGVIGLSLGALKKYWSEKMIVWKLVPVLVVLSLIGAVVGSNLLLSINPKTLSLIIGLFVIFSLPLFIFSPNLGISSFNPSATRKFVGHLLYFIVMVYAAFFGGGSGVLVFYILMFFFGLTVIKSSATGLVPWFPFSILSLIIFSIHGIVDYKVGVVLFFGMLLGGYIGARTGVKKGNKWAKSLFVVIAFISSVKLLFF